jgi:pilus assembly protein CpaE
MTRRTRIFISGGCDGLDQLLRELVERQELEIAGWSESVAKPGAPLTGGDADVVLHATRGQRPLAEELDEVGGITEAPVVVLVSDAPASFLDEAVSAEAAYLLLMPQSADAVLFAIRRAAEPAVVRYVYETAEEPFPTAAPRKEPKVITVFSPKGGAGKTVVATNLSSAFATAGERTLLIDLDLQFGDASLMLGLEPDRTLHNLVTAPGELDAEKLAGYLTHHDCGLDVLAAPLRPQDAELVGEGKVSTLLNVARESYDVIVVDTSPYFSGPMLAALDSSDEILLLCSAFDVTTVKNVRLALKTLGLLSFPSERIALVLNRFNPRVDMKREEIEAALAWKIRFELPNDPAVREALNRGRPVILGRERSAFASAIRTLAGELIPSLEPREDAQPEKEPSKQPSRFVGPSIAGRLGLLGRAR